MASLPRARIQAHRCAGATVEYLSVPIRLQCMGICGGHPPGTFLFPCTCSAWTRVMVPPCLLRCAGAAGQVRLCSHVLVAHGVCGGRPPNAFLFPCTLQCMGTCDGHWWARSTSVELNKYSSVCIISGAVVQLRVRVRRSCRAHSVNRLATAGCHLALAVSTRIMRLRISVSRCNYCQVNCVSAARCSALLQGPGRGIGDECADEQARSRGDSEAR